MIIIIDEPGQLCNRLWAYSPFIALGFHFKKKVLILQFNEYIKYFPNIQKNKLIKCKIVNNKSINNILVSLILILVKIAVKIKLINIKKINYDKSGNGLKFIKAWKTEKPNEILLNNKKEIINLFRPEYFNKDNLIKYKNNGYVLVGVHIRRGDYKKFKKGRYLFSDSVYLKAIDTLKKSIADKGKEVCFFICSDENISELANQLTNC
ncbi:MAG TPA: hypothetical protein DCY00_00350, partial [Actinobacteria bacterium]|nr:hypothetical protein [Actinomycetota bacterium]